MKFVRAIGSAAEAAVVWQSAQAQGAREDWKLSEGKSRADFDARWFGFERRELPDEQAVHPEGPVRIDEYETTHGFVLDSEGNTRLLVRCERSYRTSVSEWRAYCYTLDVNAK